MKFQKAFHHTNLISSVSQIEDFSLINDFLLRKFDCIERKPFLLINNNYFCYAAGYGSKAGGYGGQATKGNGISINVYLYAHMWNLKAKG